MLLSYLLVYKLRKYLQVPCKSVEIYGSLLSVQCGSVKDVGYPPTFHGCKLKLYRSFPVKAVFYLEFN